MKKEILLIIILLFISSAGISQHRIGVVMDGAMVLQLDNSDMTEMGIGAQVGVGTVYQYHYNRFLLQTGITISESYTQTVVDSQHVAVKMRDTEGIDFIYRGEVYNRRDQMLTTELSIPLMLGVKLKYFYALAGVRFIYPLAGVSFSNALLTTKGDYGNRYYEMLENMPQHGYFTALSIDVEPEKIALPMNVNVCAEFGYSKSIGKKMEDKKPFILQAGAFVEYNVLNGLKNATNSLMDVDCSRYMQVTMHHIYSTLPRQTHFMRQLSIGVRVTLLFSAGKKASGGGVYREMDGQDEICLRKIMLY